MSDVDQIAHWANLVGVPGLLAVGLYGLHKGWVVTSREYRRACKEYERLREEDRCRYEELKTEKNEWKAAAMRHLNMAERAVDTAAKTAEGVTINGGG